MISEPDDIREALFKTTAGELLRVPPNAARSEVCTALLRKVQEAEFVPEPGLTYGAELLGGFEPPRRQSRADHSESVEALAGECERSLREQVEQFAATFFSLPVYERRWHFDQLQEQVEGFPRVETRLRVLEEGLSIDLDDLRGESPQMVELAQRVCALHVLRPQARAQLRQAMHRDLEADGRDWEKAARYLRRNWNPISCLAPEFINPLAIMTKKRRQLTAKHKRVMTQGVKIRTTSTRAGWTARAAGPAIVLVLIGLFNFVTRQWEEHPRPVRIPTRDYKPYSKPFEMPTSPPYQPPTTPNPRSNPLGPSVTLDPRVIEQIQSILAKRKAGEETSPPIQPMPLESEQTLTPPALPPPIEPESSATP